MPKKKPSRGFYHDHIDELADEMGNTIEEWRKGNFTDYILAVRCASTAFKYLAAKRGFKPTGDNEDMVRFALHNEEVSKGACALEPICKHFKKK